MVMSFDKHSIARHYLFLANSRSFCHDVLKNLKFFPVFCHDVFEKLHPTQHKTSTVNRIDRT
jgi:hypothetical protein